MMLTNEQLKFFHDNGYLLLPGCFSAAEVEALNAELPGIFSEDTPRRILETDGKTVRSVFGSHLTNDVHGRLSRDARLVDPVMQMLESFVYIHQYKINAKLALAGDVWEWHQDYIFWRQEDGMPEDRVISATVFLNDVTEFNGPLIFVPGSHKDGTIMVAPLPDEEVDPAYADSPAWISNTTAKLKYTVDKATLKSYVDKTGLVAPKGPAGSVVFFHGNLLHGSVPNMSPYDRIVAIVSYNSVDNRLVPVANPRPEFISSTDYTPVQPVS